MAKVLKSVIAPARFLSDSKKLAATFSLLAVPSGKRFLNVELLSLELQDTDNGSQPSQQITKESFSSMEFDLDHGDVAECVTLNGTQQKKVTIPSKRTSLSFGLNIDSYNRKNLYVRASDTLKKQTISGRFDEGSTEVIMQLLQSSVLYLKGPLWTSPRVVSTSTLKTGSQQSARAADADEDQEAPSSSSTDDPVKSSVTPPL